MHVRVDQVCRVDTCGAVTPQPRAQSPDTAPEDTPAQPDTCQAQHFVVRKSKERLVQLVVEHFRTCCQGCCGRIRVAMYR